MMALVMLMSIGAFAQDGKMALGVNLGFAAYGDSYYPFGLGVKGQYELIKNVRAEAAANYWLPKNSSGVMDINVNLHYLIELSDGAHFYPIAGVCYSSTHGDTWKTLTGGQEQMFGFNVGAGVEYFLSETIKVNADLKYQHSKRTDPDIKYNGPVLQIGAAYCF